jgi:hypothetical protein
VQHTAVVRPTVAWTRAHLRGADALVIAPQTDGVDHLRRTTVAVRCVRRRCSGTLTVTARTAGRVLVLGRTALSLHNSKTAKIPMRLTARALTLIRRHRRGLRVTATARLKPGGAANTVVARITVR